MSMSRRSDQSSLAEARVVGLGEVIPGGVAEQAEESTAAHDEDKVTIADVLRWNATAKLPKDKAVRRGRTRWRRPEAAHAPGEVTKPYGVGAALAEEARHNQEESS